MDEQPVDWLDDEEMRAWRGLVEVYADVHASLEAELLEGFGFSEGDYARAREPLRGARAPAAHVRSRRRGCTCRRAASPAGSTASCAPGWWRASPAPPTGGSPSPCSPTPGYAALEAAAPVHVDGVRRHFLGHLSRAQVRQLGTAFDTLRRVAGRCRDDACEATGDATSGSLGRPW